MLPKTVHLRPVLCGEEIVQSGDCYMIESVTAEPGTCQGLAVIPPDFRADSVLVVLNVIDRHVVGTAVTSFARAPAPNGGQLLWTDRNGR